MLNRVDKEQLRNFLIILFLSIIIYLGSLSITLHHQYKFIKSQTVVNQFESKVFLFNDITADFDQVIMCQKEINNKRMNNTPDEILTYECDKNLIELDTNLKKLSEIFIINNDTNQKIVQVLNRKNPKVLDKQSVTLIEQILTDLGNRLNVEEKQIDLQHPVKY